MNANIFSEDNLSRGDISVRYVFQKCFPRRYTRRRGVFKPLRFYSCGPGIFLRHANAGVRESIFMEQLALIEKHRHGLLTMVFPPQSMLMTIFSEFCASRKSKPTLTICCVHFEVTKMPIAC
jgi:hypothetical protein